MQRLSFTAAPLLLLIAVAAFAVKAPEPSPGNIDMPVAVKSVDSTPAVVGRTFTISSTKDIEVLMFGVSSAAWTMSMEYDHPSIPDSTIEFVNWRITNANGVGPWNEIGEEEDEGCTGLDWNKPFLSRGLGHQPNVFCQPVSVGSEAGQLTTGSNTLDFLYFGPLDSLSSGYDVFIFDFLKSGYEYRGGGVFSNRVLLTDEGYTFDEDMSAYSASRETDDINAGRVLWKSGTLVNDPLMDRSTIASVCQDCHDDYGVDVSLFHPATDIVKRSMFHGLTRAEGQQIAAYLYHVADSIGLFDPTNPPGRSWNPVQQPGPGLDQRTTAEWMAGAGWENIINDTEMFAEVFGKSATYSDVDWRTSYEKLNPRETRMSVSLFTISEWYARFGMPDLIGRHNWETSDCYTSWYGPMQSNLDDWLATGKVSGGTKRDLGFHKPFYAQGDGCANAPEGFVDVNSYLGGIQRVSYNQWMLTKATWELFRRKDGDVSMWDSTAIKINPPTTIYGESNIPQGDFRSFPSAIQLVFNQAGHKQKWISSRNSPFRSSYSGYGRQPQRLGGLQSFVWYAAYVPYGMGNRNHGGSDTAPDDHKYTFDFSDAADHGGFFHTGQFVYQHFIWMNQMVNAEGVSTMAGLLPRHDHPSYFLRNLNYRTPSSTGSLTPDQMRQVLDAAIRWTIDTYGYWGSSDAWPASRVGEIGNRNPNLLGSPLTPITYACPRPGVGSEYIYQPFHGRKAWPDHWNCFVKDAYSRGASWTAIDSLVKFVLEPYWPGTGPGVTNDYLYGLTPRSYPDESE